MNENEDVAPVRVPPVNKRGGAWIMLGEEEYRVPALGLRELQDFQPQIDLIQSIVGLPNKAQIEAMSAFVGAAVRRNYPSITDEQLLDMLDLGNILAVLGKVFAGNGFMRGARASGEALASTGMASTRP